MFKASLVPPDLTARRRPRAHFRALTALVIGAIVLTGCESGSKNTPAAHTTTQAPAAEVAIAPASGTTKVALNKKVTVKVKNGGIASVEVTAANGQVLKGGLSTDRTSWTSTGKLAAHTTYTVTVAAAAPDGRAANSSSSFETVTPKGSVTALIQPSNGLTVGVGMPVIVNFSRPVSTKKRAGVEKALTVTTSNDAEGAWRWFTSEQIQWRPKTYWKSHTKVTVSADLAGVEIQPGVWGSTQKRTSKFNIGSATISTVDVSGHTMTVRRDGKVLRVIPVTTGKKDMATRNGIKVIMGRETEHRMDSTTIGIKKGDPGYYNILTHYAMRLTYSGEFLHAAPWSTGAQGRANVSHGCTGMTMAAAKWLFNHSKLGDVVIYKHSTRKLEWGNGYTAWNMSYSRWKSA